MIFLYLEKAGGRENEQPHKMAASADNGNFISLEQEGCKRGTTYCELHTPLSLPGIIHSKGTFKTISIASPNYPFTTLETKYLTKKKQNIYSIILRKEASSYLWHVRELLEIHFTMPFGKAFSNSCAYHSCPNLCRNMPYTGSGYYR